MPLPFPPTSPLPTDPNAPTTTAQTVVQTQNAPIPQDPEVKKEDKKRHTEFRQRIDVCKIYRRKLVSNWVMSIDYRRGKPFASQTDEDRIAVNLDWSMTKAKQATLFSQVPQVRVDHTPQSLEPWIKTYEQRLNDIMVVAGIEAAMDEVMPDVINAAGFGAILVSYESITEDKQVPSIDPKTLPPGPDGSPATTMPDGSDIPMMTIPQVVDHRYKIQRISPADLLWPINFTGSNFDDATWLGRSGRVTWAEAVQRFKLKDSDKDTVMGEDRQTLDRLTHDIDKDKTQADEMVGFDEIFYQESAYDEKANSFSTIHHLVFVQGKDEPVIDGPWEGQRIDPNAGITGSLKRPLRVLTLTYVSDETLPPSDSAIGRPQVNEINKSRTQMILQRERSLPVRWFDVNRVDPVIQQSLMRGTWQTMIPVQGQGDHIIGEVARASMPQENFAFDKVVKDDLNNMWTIGPNQEGSGSGIDTAAEANILQSNFQTRIGRERAKVASFIAGIAEVLGGLVCLYEDPSSLGQGFDPSISRALAYSILPDSTVLLDATQKIQRLTQFLNQFAKSGWVKIEPILKEIASLSGVDPNQVIQAPEPKPPVEPNISLRLTGVEDLLNPLTLAFLMKSGQAPSADLIEQAKALIQQAVVAPQGMEMPTQPLPMGGLPMLPQGPGVPPPAGPAGPPLPPPQAAPPAGPPPSPQPPPMGEAHPKWTVMPTLDKRSEGGQ